MIYIRILFPLNILRKNAYNFAKFCNAFIIIRSRLGLLPFIFCLFVTELWPLIDVRNLFLFNIFRTWPFCSMKSAAAGLKSDSLIILVLLFLSSHFTLLFPFYHIILLYFAPTLFLFSILAFSFFFIAFSSFSLYLLCTPFFISISPFLLLSFFSNTF